VSLEIYFIDEQVNNDHTREIKQETGKKAGRIPNAIRREQLENINPILACNPSGKGHIPFIKDINDENDTN
jgi:hypothetical protein